MGLHRTIKFHKHQSMNQTPNKNINRLEFYNEETDEGGIIEFFYNDDKKRTIVTLYRLDPKIQVRVQKDKEGK